MHLDPILINLSAIAAILVIVGTVMRRFRQPSVISYLLAGVLVGPHGAGLLPQTEVLERFGAVGILLLLFFLGMEMPIPTLVARWRTLVIGTAFQVAASVAITLAIGEMLGWPLARSVLLGFVTSLSSTAVVISVLREQREVEEPLGQIATGVLLVQDIAVIPMLIALGLIAGHTPNLKEVGLQVTGAVLLIGLTFTVLRYRPKTLPLVRLVVGDDHLELYSALLSCFVLALVSGLLGLSAALGAFVAGIVVAATDEKHWIEERLEPFHVLLVGAFFIAVGAQVDLRFVWDNLAVIALLVGAALLTNTLINAAIFRRSGLRWGDAFYGGALLSQIGEFSLVLAAVGLANALITPYAYQLTVATISLSLLLTPFYVRTMRKLKHPPEPQDPAVAKPEQSIGPASVPPSETPA